ncbi:MAG TPA: trimethylamine methyltransferase family protein [Candidatus Polarisedimenticolia bacterium]|nr:trimethylamine methyltransferase family protein [Candidatus Polarisedimenticolia bacterium]
MNVRPKVTMLTEKEVKLIHEASLEILEKTGVLYDNKQALDILEANGQKIDRDRGVAYIKPDLVDRCIKSAPRKFTLASRNGKADAVIDGERMHHMTDGQASFTVDDTTGQQRSSTLADLTLSTLLADALDPIKVVWSTVFPTDASTDKRALFETASSFMWSSKHFEMVGGVQDPEDVPYILDMIDAVTGDRRKQRDRPIFSMVTCPVSPLKHDEAMTEACIALAREWVPIVFWPMPLQGATAPITVAGTVLMTNVEFLSGLVLYQCVQPGLPMIYPAGPETLDMKTSLASTASPEGMLFNFPFAAMTEFYQVPYMAGGICSDAKIPGIQCAYENMGTGMTAALSGCDLLVGIGILNDGNTLSLPQMVIDEEICNILSFVRNGIEISKETLMLDSIHRVGHSPNHHLAEPATMEFLKAGKAYWPRISFRGSYGDWRRRGKDEVQLARDRMKELLDKHEVDPLPAEVQKELRRILAKRTEFAPDDPRIEGVFRHPWKG